MPILRDDCRANRVTDDDRTIELAGVVLRGHLISQATFDYATENAPTIADLRRTVGHLARGPLNRILRRSPVPGARSSWLPGPPTVTLHLREEPLEPSSTVAWLQEQREHAGGDRGLVSVSRAHRTDGRTLVTVQYPHTAADGGAMYAALLAASRGLSGARTPDERARAPRITDDLVDSGRQFRRLIRTVREREAPRTPVPAVERPAPGGAPAGDGPTPLVVALSTTGTAWKAAAKARSASGNTLLVAFMTDLLLSTERYAGIDAVPTNIPIDVRAEGSRDANNTASVTVAVTRDAIEGDLAGLHATIKAALVASGNRPGTQRRSTPLEVAAHFIPDALVDRLAGPHPLSMLTCSNMGAVDPDFPSLFGLAADRILMVAAPTPVTPERLARGGGGLAAWLDIVGDTLTLSVVCLDPLVFADAADAQRHLAATAERFGIAPEFWNI